MQDGLPPPVPPPLPPPRGTVRPASAPRRRRHVAARARVITAWASVAAFAVLALGVLGTSATANSSAVPPTTNPAPSPAVTDPYPRPAAPYNGASSYAPPAASTHGS